MKASRDCRELEGSGSTGNQKGSLPPTSCPHPHCIPIYSDLLEDGPGLARLENQVMLLRLGAVHGLACGILDTFLMVQMKPLPSPNFSVPTQHISATATCFWPQVLGKQWPGQTGLFPSWDQG